jgi:hypothetical protein
MFAYKILGTKRKIRIKEVFELQKFKLSTFYCSYCSSMYIKPKSDCLITVSQQVQGLGRSNLVTKCNRVDKIYVP